MYNKRYRIKITIGRGTKAAPEFIEGVTVQCKNCQRFSESGHCEVMHSQKMSGESWCATSDPKFFFKPKKEE